MTFGTTQEDDIPLIEMLYPALGQHPNREAIEALIAGHVNELEHAVGRDPALMARIYSGLAGGFWTRVKGDVPGNIVEEMQATARLEALMVLQDMKREMSQSPNQPDPPRPPLKAWDITNALRRTPEGQRLHTLQYGADEKNTGQVGWKDLPQRLIELAPTLLQIEERFIAAATETTLELHPSRGIWEANASFEELANAKHRVIFADYHLFDGYIWQSLSRFYLADCFRRVDRRGMAALFEARATLPPYFQGVLTGDLGDLPAEFDRLLQELDADLVDGLRLTDLREKLKDFGIERLNVAPKTWIDGLCEGGYLEPCKKDGKAAYRKGLTDWPPGS